MSPGTACAAASHIQPRQRTLAFRDGGALRITEIPGATLYSVSAVNHFLGSRAAIQQGLHEADHVRLDIGVWPALQELRNPARANPIVTEKIVA